MPSQTFLNLPEAKKKRVIAGAMLEFSEKPLNEASISNIVKNAEISRGSFYQYFEDKKDLYFYLIGKFRYNYSRLMHKNFEENEGSFYDGYLAFGKKYIKWVIESKQFGFFENLYLHMNYQINREAGANLVAQGKSKKKRKSGQKRIINTVNRENLKLTSDEELLQIMQYIMSLLNDTIMEGFWKKLSVEDIQVLFEKRLSWISYGVLKDSDELLSHDVNEEE